MVRIVGKQAAYGPPWTGRNRYPGGAAGAALIGTYSQIRQCGPFVPKPTREVAYHRSYSV